MVTITTRRSPKRWQLPIFLTTDNWFSTVAPSDGGNTDNSTMKITDIEVIPLRIPYEERIRKAYYHFAMTEEHTVYKFHTDNGLVGLGENVGPPFDQDLLDPYLGTDPFDHIMSTGRFNLDMACYDLMGKHLGHPAWKIMGQQRREWISMGWWMPCMSPEDSAAEIEAAAERGYRGLKCKARAFYDVIECARAMQDAAPSDFRVEFDFNGALINVEKALPILRELETIPIVKGIEEPIFAHDVEGWRRLHNEIRIPFYLHGVSTVLDGPVRQPSGPWNALRAGDFDGALCSHEHIRNALAASWAFAAANTPILLQYVGSGITAAFACQMGAVMHTATLPGVTASHSYEDDLIQTAHPVQRGFMKVPEGPGLGVELDESAVARYQDTPEPEWPRYFSIVKLPGAIEHYYRNLQQAERLMKLGVDESFAPGVRLEEREDDGSEAFDRTWKELQEKDWPIWEV